jgi:hypothetical protein
MEPEEIKKHMNFEEEIDKMYDEQSRKLYSYIEVEGEKAFQKEGPLYKFLKTDLFERLISHFESTEEYEKCAYILKVSQIVKEKIF